MSEPAVAPNIQFGRDEVSIEFPRLFGPGGEAEARRFVRRVFAFPHVRLLSLSPGKAVVRHQLGGTEPERKAFLRDLASAIGGKEEGLDDALVPAWNPSEPTTLHRFGPVVSLFEIAQTGPSRLQLRHAAIGKDPGLGRRLEDSVKSIAGVRQATATGSTGRLWVSYEPQAVDVPALIRRAEAQLLTAPGTALASVELAPAKLGLANATLGLAALGEFALPVVLPVCVGMLVVNNLGTIRDAGRQLGKGKIGLPVLHTALLGCSITTGQIVAHALMEWSFKFWERRSNAVLAEECKALLEQALPMPAQARVVRSDEVDAQVPSGSLRPGQRIRVEAPAAIPADGRVVGGAALVEQSSVRGDRGPARKVAGDEVLAGSRLLNGQIEVEVSRAGTQTQAAQIARHFIEAARNLGQSPALLRQAEAMADKPVKPTLAVAGVGWAVGGLFTVGAVLHQDHLSGPKLAIPLETLRDMGMALRGGVVVRQPDAWQRLAESRFVVLDDHPAWAAPGIMLESLHSRLPPAETDNLLCHVAGAGLYLGDGRAEALAESCRERGLVVRQPALVALGADRVTVRQGAHTITLRDDEDEEMAGLALKVEIDGNEAAWLRFRASPLPRAAMAVQRLRRQGVPVFLLSGRPADETGELARRLGTELYGGDFSPQEKLRFLQGLKKRGVLASYIGNGAVGPGLAQEAHVTVSLDAGGHGIEGKTADLLVLGDSLDAFADSFDLALGHAGRIQQACRQAILPNLLCVVGGYAGVLNGITSGLVANAGVNRVYQQATRSLRESQRQAGFNRISV